MFSKAKKEWTKMDEFLAIVTNKIKFSSVLRHGSSLICIKPEKQHLLCQELV